MHETKVSYLLRSKSTGEFVRYLRYSNEGSDCCGEYRYELTVNKGYTEIPLYELDDAVKLAKAIAKDAPWYNSSLEHPMLGTIDVSDLEIFERTTTSVFKKVTVEIPPTFKKLLSERKPKFLLKRYAGIELPDIADCLTIFEIPTGETFESVKRFENTTVEASWDTFHILKVFEAPEEYAQQPGEAPRFAAITADGWVFQNQGK